MSGRHFDVAIMQPGYLPWLGYFDLVAMADVFVVYDDVQFDKGGWRNRNRILTPAGPLWLTVPVLTKGRFGQRNDEVLLRDRTWPEKHARTIAQYYRRAPYFEWAFAAIEAYLANAAHHERLLDVCTEGHCRLAALIGLGTKTVLASELDCPGAGDPTARLVAICRKLGATRYISADASRAYMAEDQWRDAGIELVYQRYPHPTYPQFGQSFVSHLSIVDALMFLGPGTRALVGISHSKERR